MGRTLDCPAGCRNEGGSRIAHLNERCPKSGLLYVGGLPVKETVTVPKQEWEALVEAVGLWRDSIGDDYTVEQNLCERAESLVSAPATGEGGRMPDQDGYPTDEELARVREWDFKDPEGWFAFIRSIWWMPDWGWTEEPHRFLVSTGGWSGNEDLIGAMQDNFLLWSQTWENHRKGGHYTFRRVRWEGGVLKEVEAPTPGAEGGGA